MYICFQTSSNQSQMILTNSERFGLLLVENLEPGLMRVVASDNIGKCLSKILTNGMTVHIQ